eukprot:g994.t1
MILLTSALTFSLFVYGICSRISSPSDPFKYLSYSEIVEKLQKHSQTYPDHVNIFNAQEAFGVKSPGICGDENLPCRQYWIEVTNKKTLPKDGELLMSSLSQESSKRTRPEVFVSGALHGNERIGPLAAVALADLLLDNKAKINLQKKKITNNSNASISPGNFNPWLYYLLNTRKLVIMPTANAYGWHHNSREERGVDPNRDFPFDNPKGTCMQSTAARAVNELFREHAFQLAITFHAGMSSISYPWGTESFSSAYDCPDKVASREFVNAMATYAGHFPGIPWYQFGPLTPIVYPVSGGMEDWAYGASWWGSNVNSISHHMETSGVGRGCTSSVSSHGVPGLPTYPIERTSSYPSIALRMLNILVETSDAKEPHSSTLGYAKGGDLLIQNYDGSGSIGDGHVPRNVRMALVMLDIVEPYLIWTMPVFIKAFTDMEERGLQLLEEKSKPAIALINNVRNQYYTELYMV